MILQMPCANKIFPHWGKKKAPWLLCNWVNIRFLRSRQKCPMKANNRTDFSDRTHNLESLLLNFEEGKFM